MGTIIGKACLGFALTALAAWGADNSLGTWKLNVDQSAFTPAEVPLKSLTVTRTQSDGGVTVNSEGLADDIEIHNHYTAAYDGKDCAVTGNAPYDTVSVKQIDANTFVEERKKNGGQYHASIRIVVSNEGKVMTWTVTGVDAAGKHLDGTFVFDKQEPTR